METRVNQINIGFDGYKHILELTQVVGFREIDLMPNEESFQVFFCTLLALIADDIRHLSSAPTSEVERAHVVIFSFLYPFLNWMRAHRALCL